MNGRRRDGKGSKDRVTMLPEVVKASLHSHPRRVIMVHEQDLADGYGRVRMPDALARPRKYPRKCPKAATEWRWQWVFSQEHRWVDQQTP